MEDLGILYLATGAAVFGFDIQHVEDMVKNSYIPPGWANSRTSLLIILMAGYPLGWPLVLLQRLDDYFRRRRKRQEQEEVKQLRKQLKVLMSELKTLDFSDLEKVINWLDDIRTVSADSRVTLPNQHIIRVFQENGFFSGVNSTEVFDEENEKVYARWLIGQALTGLEQGYYSDSDIELRYIHPNLYRKFADEWRERFRKPPRSKG